MLWCDLIFNFADLLFIAPQRPPLKPHRATLSPSLLLFSFCCFPSAAGWIHCPYFLSHGLEIGSLFSTIWSRRSGVSVVVAVGPALKFRDFLTPAKARLLHRHRQTSSKSDSQPVSQSVQQPAALRTRPSGCTSPESEFRLFNHTMDSWTVTSALLLAGFISSAAFNDFDTGKSNFSLRLFLATGLRLQSSSLARRTSASLL